jgi:N,N'-diacetyllegionaminate synthase
VTPAPKGALRTPVSLRAEAHRPYVLLEVANCHGGDRNYLRELVAELAEFRGPGIGIKFQVFSADGLALRDYPHHGTYQRLELPREFWAELIEKATETKEVWLDLFDDHSLGLLHEQRSRITGVKLQASTLENRALRKGLREIDLSDKVLLTNVAAYPMPEVERLLGELARELRPCEIVAQVGIQSFPTDLGDAGLAKIAPLRGIWSGRIGFADHADASSADALWLPTVARALGASLIEKHVRHGSRPTEFDSQSSLPAGLVRQMLEILSRYDEALHQPFITPRERDYLGKTVATPVLREPKIAGTLLAPEDLDYRRTSQVGLRPAALFQQVRDGHVLAAPKRTGEGLQPADLRQATVGSLIACRLKSSRLPRKALADIGGGLTAVERCVRSCLAFRGVHHTVLATSDLEEDAPLQQKVPPGARFHRGHPVDVIDRFLGAIDDLKIDVFFRCTADNLYQSAEMAELLLRSHFESGADYTTAVDAALGTALEIISVSAVRRLRELFPTTEHSEYMTFYFVNNPAIFRINNVELPPALVRPYRLTLDYPEDLQLVRAIEAHFAETGREPDLLSVFGFLDVHPEIARLNAHLDQRYRVDSDLVARLNAATTARVSPRAGE